MRSTRHWVLIASFSLTAAMCAHAEWPDQMPLPSRSTGSYLGLGLRDIDNDRAKSLNLPELMGVEIVAVEEGAAGDHAGFRPGDVILSYNGEKILSAQQLIRLVSETPLGRRLRMTYWRGTEKKDAWLTTGVSHNFSSEEPDSVLRSRVTDVPYPMMVWRNLVLGIESEPISDQFAQSAGVKQGILIWTVNAGSPAQRAGLRAGDVVTVLCGRAVRSPRDLGFALQQLAAPTKPIAIDLVRDHKTLSLAISLEADR